MFAHIHIRPFRSVDPLCRRNKGRILNGWIGFLRNDILAFFKQPLHRLACLSLRANVEVRENLIQPIDLAFRFRQMVAEGFGQSMREAAFAIFGNALRSCCSAL